MQNLVIDEDGNKEWYVKGERHRLDGPACEWANGDKDWYVNGERHRLDGPAREYADGAKYWYVNGLLHRLDGPAVEWGTDTKEWYANGKKFSGPLELLEHGAKLEDIAEYLTPREIAKCRNL